MNKARIQNKQDQNLDDNIPPSIEREYNFKTCYKSHDLI